MSKTWFITGCSTGFGRALTEELLKSTDAQVVATARDIETLVDLKQAYKNRLLTSVLDVRNPNHIVDSVKHALDKFGRIDVLVNNAGYGIGGVLEECSMQSIRDVFDTNVFGLMEMTKAVLPTMRSQKCGHIFNFSSIAGLVGIAGISVYNGSKFAVEGVSEALSEEIAPFGIKVTIIEPGPFRTEFFGKAYDMAPENLAYKSTIGSQVRHYRKEAHKNQIGDPVKAVQIIIQIAEMKEPPLRMILGNIAMDTMLQKIKTQNDDFIKNEALSRSADYDCKEAA
ncbi:MAG: SDR family NAD(P)-dependent oxidoreductase [Alphaproteobacteria bacterium]|nr:SDR family NAD(P)-dependent oxidoreductase [Alphaproteobacteria bacterium]